jgi:methionyl-tRNA formyltransferase
LQPEKLRNNKEFFEKLNSLDLDFIIVVAYWKIVPKEVLEAPKYWCINIHGSILPKYRWASPIQEAIKNWDKETWVTIMYMSEGMDEGDILAIEKVEIWENEKTPDIFKKFEKVSPKILVKILEKIFSGEKMWEKQDNSKATYCSKIKKEDWEIKFSKQTAEEIYNKFRAYYPWPGIYSFFKWKKFNIEDCELIDYFWDKNIWEVEKIDKKTIWIITKDKKILKLKQVKLEWKKSMDILSFVNWNKEFLDYKFS